MNVGWRERNQQDATNLMFIVELLSQHVSGIVMPIFRRTRLSVTAYGVLHWLFCLWLCGAGTQAVCTVWRLFLESSSNFHTVHTAPHNHRQNNQCRTPYAVILSLVLLKMGIMMPETCWDRSSTIKIGLDASCWMEAWRCAYKRNIILNSVRQHNHFITQGNYKATCFD